MANGRETPAEALARATRNARLAREASARAGQEVRDARERAEREQAETDARQN